ncbi:hypothetical protein AAE028_24345 [Sinorhizobium sp. CB9]
MTSPDQSKGSRSRDEVLAGEYVLGVLSLEERQRVEARMRKDRNFAAIVSRWEHNLSDTTGEGAHAPISFEEYLSLEDRRLALTVTGRPISTGGFLRAFWNSLWFWRTIAFVGVLAAIVLALPPH